jgi:hypothetical protein
MSPNCPHGFPPAECLICRALGTQPQVQVEADRPPVAGRGGRWSSGAASPAPVQPDAVYPAGSGPRRPRSLAGHLVLIVAGLVAIGVGAWIVAGVVFALLHILELLAVAGVAGWAGYRLGHYRGHRQRP